VTKDKFQIMLNEVLDSMRALTASKGEEYARSDDQFANFKRSAEEAGVTKFQIWLVFFNKHMDSIKYFVKHGELKSTETLLSRIDDAILYLILMRGMYIEDRLKSDAEWNAGAGIVDLGDPYMDSQDNGCSLCVNGVLHNAGPDGHPIFCKCSRGDAAITTHYKKDAPKPTNPAKSALAAAIIWTKAKGERPPLVSGTKVEFMQRCGAIHENLVDNICWEHNTPDRDIRYDVINYRVLND
jgi:hypothetical protein